MTVPRGKRDDSRRQARPMGYNRRMEFPEQHTIHGAGMRQTTD